MVIVSGKKTMVFLLARRRRSLHDAGVVAGRIGRPAGPVGNRVAGGEGGQLDDHAAGQQHPGCRGQPQLGVRRRLAEEDPLGVGRHHVLTPGEQPGAVDPFARSAGPRTGSAGPLLPARPGAAAAAAVTTVAPTVPRQNSR